MGTRVVIQSATVVEEESSSTYTTITTITDATTVKREQVTYNGYAKDLRIVRQFKRSQRSFKVHCEQMSLEQ